MLGAQVQSARVWIGLRMMDKAPAFHNLDLPEVERGCDRGNITTKGRVSRLRIRSTTASLLRDSKKQVCRSNVVTLFLDIFQLEPSDAHILLEKQQMPTSFVCLTMYAALSSPFRNSHETPESPLLVLLVVTN